MKLIKSGCGAAIFAMMCNGCGAAPTDQSSADDTASQNAQALVTPSKGAPPRLMPNGSFVSPAYGFSYAGGGLPTGLGGLPDNVFSILGRVTVAKPDVRRATNDPVAAHSLAEVSGQDSQQLEGVEIGWIVYDDDPNPRLFVFYWTGGIGQCAVSGVPHYRCSTFVSTSSSIKPDMVLSVGATLNLGIKRVDTGSTAGWHFLYNGTDFGYVPDWALSPNFTSIQIGQWFGEVAGSTGTRCSSMGNGRWGATDSLADSFTTLQYTARGKSPVNARMNLVQTETSRYTAGFGGTQYMAPIRFGGPYLSSSPFCPPLSTCKKKLCCGGTVSICETQELPRHLPPSRAVRA